MSVWAEKQSRFHERLYSGRAASKASTREPVNHPHKFQGPQGVVGNRAVQRMMQPRGGSHQGSATNTTAARPPRDLSTHSVREAAERGTVGSGGTLPHLTEIQRSFGHHDVTHIRAYRDPRAAEAAHSIGARAYTSGDRVAFAGTPDLHTAAHEAAHVVQQRAGVQLAGNVGAAGDVYERHADAVANRVVAGGSSEALLDSYAPRALVAGKGARGNKQTHRASVQMKTLDTAYGKFEDVYYNKLTNAKDEALGCEMYLRFTPGDTVDATKIALTQIVKSYKEGVSNTVDETKQKQSLTSGKGKDFHIDRLSSARNPIYGSSVGADADKDKLGGWNVGPKVTAMTEAEQKKYTEESGIKGVKYTAASKGQYGHRKKSGADWVKQPAEMDDWPMLPSTVGKKNSGQSFETTALAVEGTQKDTYYGSVQWGWERDDKAAFKLIDFKLVSKGAPSSIFMAAAEKWNASKTSGNEATIKLPTFETYTTSKQMDVLAGTEKIKLEANTRVQVISKGAAAKDPWTVKIVDGPSTGKQVSVDGTTLTKE